MLPMLHSSFPLKSTFGVSRAASLISKYSAFSTPAMPAQNRLIGPRTKLFSARTPSL